MISQVLAETNDQKYYEIQLNLIDHRVRYLEGINDKYMASFGKMNEDIYNQIQSLMDLRDQIYKIMHNISDSQGN